LEPALAVKAIDYLADLCMRKGVGGYRAHFFGGEPFVEDDFLDVVVHHGLMVAGKTGVVPYFEASTNGVIAERRLRFVADYFSRVLVSLDGLREFHDRNRPLPGGRSSFDTVVETARYLSDSPAELSLRCCVTSESVTHMEEFAHWFCQEFSPASVNFEPLVSNSESESAGLRPPDPVEFAEHAVRSWRILQENGCEPASAAVGQEGIQTSFCPVGRDGLIVHPGGLVSSCYLAPAEWENAGLDLSVGHIDPGGGVQIREEDVRRLRALSSDKSRCKDCFCLPTCAGGCHVNNTYPGCAHEFSDYCIHTRIMTVCDILDKMGLAELVDSLLEDSGEMRKLAMYRSDRVADFGG